MTPPTARRLRRSVAALLALAIGAPLPVVASGPPPAFLPSVDVRTTAIGPAIGGLPFPRDQAYDPIVATHPTDPDRIAVSYHRSLAAGDACRSPAPTAALRVTRNGGRTWRDAPGRPWAGSGRLPNWHATIAWGPGPKGSPARLYWADTTLSGCAFSDHRLSIAWSDDLGATWSPLFVLAGVPSTGEGGYPDIAVDRDPDSPGHGTVYAAINWFPSAGSEPGFRLLASRDFGRTWDGVEVPPVPAPRGFPFAYRIGERLRTAPDGSLIAVWHQTDSTDAGRASIGRSGFGVTRVVYRPGHRPLRGARAGVPAGDVRESGGHRHAARARHHRHAARPAALDRGPGRGPAPPAASSSRCRTTTWSPGRAGRGAPSASAARTMAASPGTGRAIGPLPDVRGRPVSAHKPSLAIAGDVVAVGLHGIVDVPVGTPPDRGPATVGESVAISFDGGETFGAPVAVLRSRWDLESLAGVGNRAGLRDRMEATADGDLVWAFADGRVRGRSRIVVTRIERQPPTLVAGPVRGPEDPRTRRLPV